MVAEYFAGAFALCVSVSVRVFVYVLTKVNRCGCNGCSDGLGSADMFLIVFFITTAPSVEAIEARPPWYVPNEGSGSSSTK